MKQIYTIGYTAFSINQFVDILSHYKISCVIDVRSMPFSQHYTDYNKDSLAYLLDLHHILYRNYADEFGARQENKKFYSSGGYLDFDKFTCSSQFNSGIQKVSTGIDMGYCFVLMCAEKDPIDCHRSIMLGKGFQEHGFEVMHIKPDGRIETQHEIEQRLLNLYFKDRQQLSLFSATIDEMSLVAECYKKRNKDIGYRLEDLK